MTIVNSPTIKMVPNKEFQTKLKCFLFAACGFKFLSNIIHCFIIPLKMQSFNEDFVLTEARKYKEDIWDFDNLQQASEMVMYCFVSQLK